MASYLLGCAFIFKILAVLIFGGLINYVAPNNIQFNVTQISTTVKTSAALTSTDRIVKLSSIKKWQVGRVSRKHYEIVNMLWRKTKIFIDPQTTVPVEHRVRRNSLRTTNNYEKIKPLTYTTFLPITFSSTPSYIEFYYLDDNDERIKQRDSLVPIFENSQTRRQLSNNNAFLQSPVLSFRINDRTHKYLPKERVYTDKPLPTERHQLRKQPKNEKPSIYGILSSRFKIGYGPMLKPLSQVKSKNNKTTILYVDNETCPSTTQESINFLNKTNSSEIKRSGQLTFETNNLDTTVYDKIKFFEIYDDHTIKPLNIVDKFKIYADDSEKLVKENEIIQKTDLEDIDRSIKDHHDGKKVKNVKKHIDQNIEQPILNENKDETEIKSKFKSVTFNVNKTAAELRNSSRKILHISSRVALWSDYPFAAVYVYEPSQIHCDSAALSPHWLVAAGSCLSRYHNKDPETEFRSAFVAYGGQNWWRPERVAYVKYSIVHPRFHPKDDSRKYLYNIGLIQVVGSMSSCFGWAPVSLMSHHFAAESDGSMATAVGWGLDRYDVRYSPITLPKFPLAAFDSYVYSESCPGSTNFGKEIYNNVEENTVKNTYCLSLPPYFGEQNDPVHGSLLLVGGKLIALYLQEERRVRGEQSAQYTGVWRLVPWVNEVAREPEEIDGFAIDL